MTSRELEGEPDDLALRVQGEPARSIGVMGALGRASLKLASVFYGAGAWAHRSFMRRTAAGRGQLACAVVSVGGLTVGGAGKTPVAARLAMLLHARGWRVVLASRGYKGRSRKWVTVVSDGSHIHSSVEHAGDESFVLVAHAPGVPVLVGRDRRVVGHHAVSAFDAEILVLDDGFQHHRLARDLDIVCVDGIAGFGNQRLLPAGPLRESRRVLRYADWLCVVDGAAGQSPKSDESFPGDEVARTFSGGEGEIICATRRPIGLVSLDRSRTRSVESLRDRRVGLLCGVARPTSVQRTLESLGAHVAAERRFPDHHEFTPSDCADLDHSSLLWVTTEKDALKILPKWLDDETLWVLQIEVGFEEEQEMIDRLEERLRQAGRL